jgi:predicted Zn-dependent protease
MGPLNREDTATFEGAVRFEQAGDVAGAAAALAPIAAKYPKNARVHFFGCYLALRTRVATALDTCRAAHELPSIRMEIHAMLGAALLERGEKAAGVRELLHAEEVYATRGADAATWLHLAQLFERAQTCTAAERAAARVRGSSVAERLSADCRRTRSEVGLPADAAARGVPAEREAEYIAGVVEAAGAIRSRKLDDARRQAAELATQFPGSPAAAVIGCLIDARGGAADAQRRCTDAVEAVPDAFHPRFVLGALFCEQQRWPEAAAHLKAALALDEGTSDVWISLATTLSHIGAPDELRTLSARYKRRFGLDLKPRPACSVR